MQHDPWVTLATLILAAVLPPLIYVVILRNSERFGRQSWRSVLSAFFYGALISVVLVFAFTFFFGGALNRFLVETTALSPRIVPVVLAAPLVEEFFKGFGLRKHRPRIREIEDGIIYAGAIALGFAATENFLYQATAFLQGGPQDWWSVVVARSVSSTLLHPAATGLIGLGYGGVVARRKSIVRVLPYYLAAVGLHALYNYTVVAGLTFVVPVHLPVAIVLAVVGFVIVRQSIVGYDRQRAQAA